MGLVPNEFFLFSKLKRPMKDRGFAKIKEIKIISLNELKGTYKNAYQNLLRGKSADKNVSYLKGLTLKWTKKGIHE